MSTAATIRLVATRQPLAIPNSSGSALTIDVARFVSMLARSLPGPEVIVPAAANIADVSSAASTQAAVVRVDLGSRSGNSWTELASTGSRFAVTIYSSRREAHDWLAGEPGAWRASMRCLQALIDRGVPTDAEIVLTRPTLPHLPELAEVLSRMRPDRVVFRLPADPDVAGDRVVMLLPRLPGVLPAVAAAATRLENSRVACVAEGFPSCVGSTPIAVRLCRIYAAESLAAIDPERCPSCDLSCCGGVPRNYVEAFGWGDLEIHPPHLDRVVVPLRAPSPITCVQCIDTRTERDATRARAMRMRLTHAAATRARTLRIVGSGVFWHDESASLLRDATRLGFDRVDVAGELSGLARFSDGQVARLRGLTRVDFPIYGPTPAAHDAHAGADGMWDRTLASTQRLLELAGVESEPFAIVHDLRDLPAYAESWTAGVLPGAPRFRMMMAVDSDELIRWVREIDEPRSRLALQSLLPSCCFAGSRTPSGVEWQRAERFESHYKRSPADPAGEAVRCSRCSANHPMMSAEERARCDTLRPESHP